MKNTTEQEYKIKSTKPSKYKKSGTWIESSGELSKEEISQLFLCDQTDSTQELVDKKDKDWKRLAILNDKELLVGQKRNKKFKIDKKDIDGFTL